SGTNSPLTSTSDATITAPAAWPTWSRTRCQRASPTTTPTTATTKLTSVGPPSHARRPSGESACAKASRPQGNPPKGHEDRSTSPAVHTTANTSGARTALRSTRERWAKDHATHATPTSAASTTLSATQGTGPTT